MTNDQIQRGIEVYVRRYKDEKSMVRRDNICREVGFYLSNVTTREEDFMKYASMFLTEIDKHTLIEKLKKAVEDWI